MLEIIPAVGALSVFVGTLSVGALGLDGYFNKVQLYCRDCKSTFLSRPTSSDHMTHDMSCSICGSDNTFQIGINLLSHHCKCCEKNTEKTIEVVNKIYCIKCKECGDLIDLDFAEVSLTCP